MYYVQNSLEKLGSPELKLSDITFRAYDRRPSVPVGLYQGIPVQLVGKTVFIDIKVLDAQLDYNILLGRSYMYEMSAVVSSVFRVMMFPHDGKMITIDQLTYYEKKTLTTPDGVLPFIGSSPELVTTYTEFGPIQFEPATLLRTFPGDPLVIEDTPPDTGAPMCMMSIKHPSRSGTSSKYQQKCCT